jgi:hypothetical protein
MTRASRRGYGEFAWADKSRYQEAGVRSKGTHTGGVPMGESARTKKRRQVEDDAELNHQLKQLSRILTKRLMASRCCQLLEVGCSKACVHDGTLFQEMCALVKRPSQCCHQVHCILS